MTVATRHVSTFAERFARRFDSAVLTERLREFAGGHSIETDHEPHIIAAVEWIARAQDSTGSGGIARGYAVAWNPYFALRGWEPAYPETTGYIIPTLYSAARALGDPSLAARAYRAAEWELGIQLPSGAVRAGILGRPPSPAIFNTGQVIFGWLSAHAETGESQFAGAALAAARYLISTLDDDGMWRRDNSRFALSYSTLYNARVSWALAEVGQRLNMPAATDAAARSLAHVARLQRKNGWIPSCCLTEPARPLLHTLAYATRGLLEGGRVLEDPELIRRASIAAG
ncbi:MAG TPA: hypothetical protein VGQ30_13150, partial [Gemmatimonadaceae bacterium]|nr:hypothetical protein [Gemmatimonadaceae bacterium]